MLPKLSESQFFKDELKLFEIHMQDLPNDKKIEAQRKIASLLELVEYVDTGHTQKIGSRITPSLMDNTRSQIVDLRKQIAKICNIRL